MATREQIANFTRRLGNRRDRLLAISPTWLATVVLPPLLFASLALFLTFHFLRPLPPRTLTMAIGNPRGSYARYAAKYQEAFARAGIRLVLKSTEGAADSLALLREPGGEVGAAILQDGLANPPVEGLRSVAAIGYEPIWVFYRSRNSWSRLADLGGKRISIGRWGAGTQPFALDLLREASLQYNVESFIPPGRNIRIATLSALEALDELKQGRLDAVVTLGEPESPVVQAFFHTPDIKVMTISQAEAVARHRTYLHRVIIPRGGIDLHSDLPSRDLTTLATTSVVYVRADMHPALVTLLTGALVEVHQETTLLAAKHEFPADLDVAVPQHPVAGRYLRNGPPFLTRYLPFWLATLLDRTVVVLLPLLALLIPASRLLPQLYNWRIRRRLDRWYAELKFLEAELDREDSQTDRGLLLDRIGWIEQQLARLRLPLSFSNQLYILKEHLELVRRRILRVTRIAPPAPAAAEAATLRSD
jgi:TRAP-type uncharacterized transport system substrate-binding protein